MPSLFAIIIVVTSTALWTLFFALVIDVLLRSTSRLTRSLVAALLAVLAPPLIAQLYLALVDSVGFADEFFHPIAILTKLWQLALVAFPVAYFLVGWRERLRNPPVDPATFE